VKRKRTDAEAREEMIRNAERTRELALKGQAALDARTGKPGRPPEEGFSTKPFSEMSDAERLREMRLNAERTRQLAQQAQAELDRRKQQSA
jgi:hypothetical protein